MRIPLSGPDITEAEIEAVVRVMRSGRLSLGPKLEEFEAKFCSYAGCAYAAAVSSGTAGLHLAIRALGIGESDEVVLPSFTFIAVANAIRYEHATPVFADIDPDTLNMTPAACESAITAKTRAIVAVHTFGVPADIDGLAEIARRHNLLLIEDACEALGAERRAKKVGTFGAAGIFGFYPNKQITTAEGGVIVSNDETLTKRVRSLRNQGRTPGGNWLEHEELGFNYRLSEMHAALGVEQLKRINSILARRQEIARGYRERLKNSAALILPIEELPEAIVSWFVYVVRLAPKFTREQRDAIIAAMSIRGIACGRYFAPIHLQAPYRSGDRERLPVTEQVGERTIALPFFNALKESQLDEVCETLKNCIEWS